MQCYRHKFNLEYASEYSTIHYILSNYCSTSQTSSKSTPYYYYCLSREAILNVAAAVVLSYGHKIQVVSMLFGVAGCCRREHRVKYTYVLKYGYGYVTAGSPPPADSSLACARSQPACQRPPAFPSLARSLSLSLCRLAASPSLSLFSLTLSLRSCPPKLSPIQNIHSTTFYYTSQQVSSLQFPPKPPKLALSNNPPFTTHLSLLSVWMFLFTLLVALLLPLVPNGFLSQCLPLFLDAQALSLLHANFSVCTSLYLDSLPKVSPQLRWLKLLL